VELTVGFLGKNLYVSLWNISQLSISLVLILSFDAIDELTRKTVSLNCEHEKNSINDQGILLYADSTYHSIRLVVILRGGHAWNPLPIARILPNRLIDAFKNSLSPEIFLEGIFPVWVSRFF
jgi:hypothetical protein